MNNICIQFLIFGIFLALLLNTSSPELSRAREIEGETSPRDFDGREAEGVRQRFWPINGRNLARKVSHECIVCFKAKPIPSEQLLGDLPYERVNQNYVFNCTGIDFCGPFLIRYKNQKWYIQKKHNKICVLPLEN